MKEFEENECLQILRISFQGKRKAIKKASVNKYQGLLVAKGGIEPPTFGL
jgi:hypothetical protein